MIESIHTNFLFVWRFKYEEIIRSTVFEFMKTFNSFDSVCKMQLLNNSKRFSSCRDGSSPNNYSTNSPVKSYCRPYWDNQDLRPYISDYYQNLTHNTESLKECPSIKPNASCYLSKKFLSTFSIFYCNSCRFFVDLFCNFFKLKKTDFYLP